MLRLLALLAALLVTLGGVPPEPPSVCDEDCVLCVGDGEFECGRCEGKGSFKRICGRCTGSKRVPCLLVSCEKGKVPCPACGGAKEIRWDTGEKDPCKVCKRKGTLACGFCKGRAQVPCPRCDGKGKHAVDCIPCLAQGFFPCPNDRSDPCRVCKGKDHLPCTWCEGVGSLADRCEWCADSGRRLCGDCERAGVKVCDQCHGAGSYRINQGASKSNKEACGVCKRRGSERCKRCDDGIVPCTESPSRFDCPRCEDGTIPCKR